MLTPEFERTIRQRINPAHKDTLGTESHERATLLGEIDRLRTELEEMKKVCGTWETGAKQSNDLFARLTGQLEEAKKEREKLRKVVDGFACEHYKADTMCDAGPCNNHSFCEALRCLDSKTSS